MLRNHHWLRGGLLVRGNLIIAAISGSIKADPKTRTMPRHCMNVTVSPNSIHPSNAVRMGVKYPDMASNPVEMYRCALFHEKNASALGINPR